MSRQVNTYVPAIVRDYRNASTFPKMVIDNQYELSGTYVKWEDYETLRTEFWKLAAKLAEQMRKTDE